MSDKSQPLGINWNDSRVVGQPIGFGWCIMEALWETPPSTTYTKYTMVAYQTTKEFRSHAWRPACALSSKDSTTSIGFKRDNTDKAAIRDDTPLLPQTGCHARD